MPDLPGRPFSSDDRTGPGEEEGWGSPVPAEYGSLRSVRSAAPAPEPRREQPSSPPPEDEHDRWGARAFLQRRHDDGAAAAPRVPAVVPAPSNGSTPPGTEAGIDPDALGPPLAPPEMALAYRRGRRARRPARVRSRATIRHLDIMTVIRVSVIFWGVMLVALIVASVLLWAFADAFGSVPSIEKSVRTLFSLKSFKLHPGTIAMYTAAGGVVLAVAGTVANVVLALIYNLIAEVVGGVRVELESLTGE